MNDISPVTVNDITKSIREAAMLAYVSIGSWSATERDDELMEAVKREHDAEGEVGTVIKFLLSGNDGKLKRVRAMYQAVRNHHYKLTLPWVTDPSAPSKKGPRLLPHLIYNKYVVEVSAKRRAALDELENFLVAYPTLVTGARGRLKTMVSDSSYPTVDQLRHRFRLHVDFQPIPSGDGFGGLDPHMLERLAKNLHDKQMRQAEDGLRVLWARAREPLEKLVDRMEVENEEDKKKFKKASIENVRSLLTFLPAWNVTGSPLVVEIAQDIDRMLAGIDSVTVRENDALRADTASAAQKILDKLDAYGL